MSREDLLRICGTAAKAAVEAQIRGADKGASPPTKPGRPRIRSKPIFIDDIRFASTHEGNYYLTLKMRQQAGQIKYFLRQIPFDLPGGKRLIIDFMVVFPDGHIEFHETKGYAMEDYLVKKSVVEALYHIKIIELFMAPSKKHR